MRKTLMTLAAALCMALPLTGCGGVSKDDYAKKADEVCRDVERRIQEIGRGQVQNAADLSRQIDRVKAAVRDATSRLKGLERPDGEDGDKAKDFVDTLDRELEQEFLPTLDQLARAIRERDNAAARRAAERLQRLQNSRSDRLAAEIGARECAN